jgi:DNA-binding MarR family transcriptional regulator
MLDSLNSRLALNGALRELGTAAKMLWVYFNLTGPVVVSQRDLSVTLGLTQRAISENLNHLSEIGFIRYKPGQDRSDKSNIKAVKAMFKPLAESFSPLLREADASTKLLYLWLLPQGDVTYTHKKVSAYLSMTEMTAVKARQELESLGVIVYQQRPAPRQHGLYHVLAPKDLQARLKFDENLALPESISGKGGELKLYWYILQKGEATSRQHALAELLDMPQSAISNAVNHLLEEGLIERTQKKGEDLFIPTQQHTSKKRTPKDFIPNKLIGEANAVQFLYVWLKPQGEVRYSYSEMVDLVRIRSNSLMIAVKRLEELGLLEVYEKPTPHRKGRFKAV